MIEDQHSMVGQLERTGSYFGYKYCCYIGFDHRMDCCCCYYYTLVQIHRSL